MVDWTSLIRLIGTIGAVLGQQKLSTSHDPWRGVGASAYLLVINQLPDSVEVRVTAPEIDSTVRYLGKAGDWSLFKLPYADTKVYVDILGTVTEINVGKPGFYTIKL